MKQEFGYFLKNAKFRAALGLTLLLSYGYAIATTRVSIDSLEGDRYIGTGGVMLSTGRFGMNLWAAVLGYGRAEPSYAFGIDLLGALKLALAAVSFCALLRKAAQDRISMFGYGLFACLFVSYPLMNEIWEYSGANVCVCGGYLLDAAALNLLWDARQPGVPWRGRALRMGAAALCYLGGGDAQAVCHAAAIAIKSMLGLVCDPIAGLVEVPCVKRNAAGAMIAMSSADMALAGIRSAVPPDEVILAMREVGDKMDVSLKETGIGGVAGTPFGQKIAEKMEMG